MIKGTRWLLLENREHLCSADRMRLDELLATNRALFTVYVLKDDLKGLWQFRYAKAALLFSTGWSTRARESNIRPHSFHRVARALRGGIIGRCRYLLHTGLVEGINNKIKVLKRMASGYREDAYFFIKIRATFPGNA